MITDGLTQGKSFVELYQLIGSLPSGLSDLFSRILASTDDDPDRFRNASEVLQIVQATLDLNPGAMELLYAVLDPEEVFGLPSKGLGPPELREKLDQVKWMITARTKCLVEHWVPGKNADGPWSIHEWHENVRFRFIHRTVADYLDDPAVRRSLLGGTKTTEK